MKWFQKIKTWFRDEEIIEIEEIIIDETTDSETIKALDFSKLRTSQEKIEQPVSENYTKEMDSKILFSYPKGEFKFPVIPDHEGRTRERPRPKKHTIRNYEEETSQKSAGAKNTADHEVSKSSKKIVPSKKPFRPTEIPSSVYGFQRPGIQRKTENQEGGELEGSISDQPNTVKTLDTQTVNRKPETIQSEIDQKNETYSKQIDEVVTIPKSPIETNKITNEQETIISEEIEKEHPPISSQVNVVSKDIQHLQSDSEKKDFYVGNEQQSENSPAGESEVASTAETEIAVMDEPSNLDRKPKKKHIPFNVIMLKQDRHKNPAQGTTTVQKSTSQMGAKMEQSQTVAYTVPLSEINKQIVAMPIDEALLLKKSYMEEPKQSEDQFRVEKADQKSVPFLTAEQEQISHIPEKSERETDHSTVDKKAANTYPEASKSLSDSDAKQQIGEPAQVNHEKWAEEQVDMENPYYAFPSIDLLTPPTEVESDEEWLDEQTTLLNDTLKNFNVRAKVVNVTQGPAVTRFEVQPEPGVKVNKVTNLMDDIKLGLAAQDIRMEAPIPGKHTIGIEIPNRKSKPVYLREVLESDAFKHDKSPLTVALGLDISGEPIVTDLRKMPHGLIAGATGSGKSVCINSMLISLLYKATPQEVKLLLIDPKMVELAPYNRLPHLVSPVITDVKAATAALKWAVEEMERRYELFVHAGVRDISRYNERAIAAEQYAQKLPYIVIIIDELADLMMMSPADVEEAISRIAQKARACGIHLIVATQRPSVDVITGLIKANIPTRIAFSVSSQVDSRTILDTGGAEKLLGKGDMLFAENGSSKSVRLQGTFVTDLEIDEVVHHVKQEQKPNYLFEQEELLSKAQVSEDTDELFFEACEFFVSQSVASTSSLQRRFKIGYNRAAGLMDMMQKQGIISESRGSKPRDVLISEEELGYILEEYTNH